MPQTAVFAAPRFETRDPTLLLAGNRLSLSLPVLNTGDATAAALTLTGVTLGSAARIEPALPLVLGDLAPGNRTLANAIFSSAGLAPGTRLMLTVRGTYVSGGQTLGFTLNRVVTVPPPSAPPVDLLNARLLYSVNTATRTWSYTLVNEEGAGSPLFLNAVSVDMVRPFTVTGTPPGWDVATDNATFVLWFALDSAHEVAPGASLAGFQIQSQPGVTASEARGYNITSMNHTTNAADKVAFGTVLVPARS